MKIEVLYIDGCPNHRPTLERIDSILKEMGITELVSEVAVATMEQARALRFAGSPTIRVDGGDIEKNLQDLSEFSYSCRMYFEGGHVRGVPSRELIRKAICEAL